jgi:hypothetical protein
MKTVILKGVEIKIGSRVRFVNDTNLYTTVEGVIKPELGNVYTVRDINDLGGFLLQEIKNVDYEWYSPQGELDFIAEPGFANWRFEPKQPANKKRKIVQVKILPEIKETIDLPIRRKVRELEPA